jgi:cbb3-type cytochrome oxidase maturation protein
VSVLVLLIFASLAIATAFLVAFIWAVRSGQYEDTGTPPLRLLLEESRSKRAEDNFQTEQRKANP